MTPRLSRAQRATIDAASLGNRDVLVVCYATTISLCASDAPEQLGLAPTLWAPIHEAIAQHLGPTDVETVKRQAWAFFEEVDPNV